MNTSAPILKGIDHLELAVFHPENALGILTGMGFERLAVQTFPDNQANATLLGQGLARVVLRHPTSKPGRVDQFLSRHGAGVMGIVIHCENAVTALETAVSRGAKIVEPPRRIARAFGEVERASIEGVGDVQITFLERAGDLFDDGYESPPRPARTEFGITHFDHLSFIVEKETLESTAEFLIRVLGFQLHGTTFEAFPGTRQHFRSLAVESADTKIRFALTSPVGDSAMARQYLDIAHGPGLDHVALGCTDVIRASKSFCSNQIPLWIAPPKYYDSIKNQPIANRVSELTDRLPQFEQSGVLVDGDEKGYLLQCFTKDLVGNVFWELLERVGSDSIGKCSHQARVDTTHSDNSQLGVLTQGKIDSQATGLKSRTP